MSPAESVETPVPAAAPPRPTTIAEYKAWALASLTDDLNDQARHNFNVNATAIQATAQRHDFFGQLGSFLDAVERDYQTATGTELLLTDQLDLFKKPFESMVEKCFRKNVLHNREFPHPPKEGWYTSAECPTRINDVVRCTLVCRYLDGPEFLAERLRARAEEMGLTAHYYSQQNERGYYAYHFYVKIPVEIVDKDWNASTVNVDVEIQLTTQLQEVLRSLTHKLYERMRLATPSADEKWKWDFGTNRFKASYLGHTLHLIEGLIVELRRATHEREAGANE